MEELRHLRFLAGLADNAVCELLGALQGTGWASKYTLKKVARAADVLEQLRVNLELHRCLEASSLARDPGANDS